MEIKTIEHMFNLAIRLFPICRSLTGDGNRQTLKIIQSIIPINIIEIPSGTKVFDWEVPEEWNIKDAYVKNDKGQKIIDFKDSNLHVIGYSEPFNGILSGESLKNHLFTLQDFPDYIPYITSYYKKRWGFCIKHNDLCKFNNNELYEAKIDSSFKSGNMTIGELIIPGKVKKEVFISTNICHPSLANNEISGMVLSTFLAKYILEKRDNYYTYRFVFLPETIGAVAYSFANKEILTKNVIAGYTVTCVGDSGNFSYLCSKYENTMIDRVTKHILKHKCVKYKMYDFIERGSDERQYCYPGMDLPVGSLMRTKYNEYPEYHTSADNLDFINKNSLYESLELYKLCLNVVEKNKTYETTTICEPQLIKYGLYPSLSTKNSINFVKDIRNVLVFCDGKHDLLWIADKIDKPMWTLYDMVDSLLAVGLVKESILFDEGV